VGCHRFVNADLIAAGLSPLAPERELLSASRLFIREIESHIRDKQDFGFETTLSGRSYLKLIRRLQSEGWRVEMIYLALDSVALSRQRVAERVQHGGHNIPLVDIERRFPRSLDNLLNRFSQAVDLCRCYMNSGTTPELIFKQSGDDRNVVHAGHFQRLQRESSL